jgi:hypothetical protein
VDLQARMVEDLDKDFSHTQERMKKLRTQAVAYTRPLFGST